MPRHTHTYVTLDVSRATYDEIAGKLKANAYGHCFNEAGEIDMSGIALVTDPAVPEGVDTVVDSDGVVHGKPLF